uniref:Ig-like domain-containing protein n=1 Tax=Myripristis murdjan TaxID=586833 RepID=A0A667WHI5_9TELE
MQCSYTYPNSGNHHITRVEKALWFTKGLYYEPVDLRSDSEYEGRVHLFEERGRSTLRISDLRESDSAVYKFRFITSQPGGRYTGEPGVSLTVTVSVRPSGEIVEGSSVTLNCSSDANPAANYTWYKKNGNPDQEPFRTGPQLDFVSIQSSDSGEFYCTAQNELGEKTSDSTSIDVKYGPKKPSVLVSPFGEIVEGSSVTLTCSSDANPAATYTWYKENQTLPQGPEGSYHFTSISSEDTGTYHCQSENQYGQNSSSHFIDGSSVNLTCSSDANPVANYTWYKNNEASPKALGQTFTITDITSEHSGEYYCEVQNKRGRHQSTLQLNVVAGKSCSFTLTHTSSVLHHRSSVSYVTHCPVM